MRLGWWPVQWLATSSRPQAARRDRARADAYEAFRSYGEDRCEPLAKPRPLCSASQPLPPCMPGDLATVNFAVSLLDGTLLHDNRPAQPLEMRIAAQPSEAVLAWDVALQAMRVGEACDVRCKPHLAYGDKGAPPLIPPGASLLFNLELISLRDGPPPEPHALAWTNDEMRPPTPPRCEQCGVASLQWRGDLEGQIYQPCVGGGACPWRETLRHLVGPLELLRCDWCFCYVVVCRVKRGSASGVVAHSVVHSRSYTVRLYTRGFTGCGGTPYMGTHT